MELQNIFVVVIFTQIPRPLLSVFPIFHVSTLETKFKKLLLVSITLNIFYFDFKFGFRS